MCSLPDPECSDSRVSYFANSRTDLGIGEQRAEEGHINSDVVESTLDEFEDDYPNVDTSTHRQYLAQYRAGLNLARRNAALLAALMETTDKPVIGDVEPEFLDAGPTFYGLTVAPQSAVGGTVSGVTLSAQPVFYRPTIQQSSVSAILTDGAGGPLLEGRTYQYGESLAPVLDLVSTKTVSTVTWYLDGSPVRDNDTAAPYEFRINGASVTVGSTFAGQGSYTGSSFTIDEGDHTISATVEFTDASSVVASATITAEQGTPTQGVAYTWPVVGLSTITVNVPQGFPGPSNTGHTTALGSLTPVNSFTTISTPGVYTGNHYSQGLAITVSGVTLRNCRVSRPAGSGAFAVEVRHGSTNPGAFVMEDCTVAATDQGQAAVGWTDNGRGFTLRRCNISGAGDGGKNSHGVHVYDCFIHDLYRGGSAHNDGLQNSGGGTNVIVSGNTILAPYRTSTSCLMNQTRVGNIDGVTITGNFFFGGSYCVYLREVDGGTVTNSSIVNNVFCDESTGTSYNPNTGVQSSGWAYMMTVSGGVTVSGNTLQPRSAWAA